MASPRVRRCCEGRAVAVPAPVPHRGSTAGRRSGSDASRRRARGLHVAPHGHAGGGAQVGPGRHSLEPRHGHAQFPPDHAEDRDVEDGEQPCDAAPGRGHGEALIEAHAHEPHGGLAPVLGCDGQRGDVPCGGEVDLDARPSRHGGDGLSPHRGGVVEGLEPGLRREHDAHGADRDEPEVIDHTEEDARPVVGCVLLVQQLGCVAEGLHEHDAFDVARQLRCRVTSSQQVDTEGRGRPRCDHRARQSTQLGVSQDRGGAHAQNALAAIRRALKNRSV